MPDTLRTQSLEDKGDAQGISNGLLDPCLSLSIPWFQTYVQKQQCPEVYSSCDFLIFPRIQHLGAEIHLIRDLMEPTNQGGLYDFLLTALEVGKCFQVTAAS